MSRLLDTLNKQIVEVENELTEVREKLDNDPNPLAYNFYARELSRLDAQRETLLKLKARFEAELIAENVRASNSAKGGKNAGSI